MRLISLTYINSSEFDQPGDWINRLYAFTGVWEALSKEHEVFCIEQINYNGALVHNAVQYYFRNGGKGVNRFPFRLHRLVKKLRPDVVLVRGLHFPLQVIQMRLMLGNKVIIICEHHADKVSEGWRKKLNRLAGTCINAYHFTSAGNAEEWVRSGNIRSKTKCREIPAGSTRFSGYDKQKSRYELGWDQQEQAFIWTGRLDKNKDPMTVIEAFKKYLPGHTATRLHMIYLEDQLLPEIKEMLSGDEMLGRAVILHGKKPQEEIQLWYSAADFYISASHYEGGSIALVEAMACGCIPVVTSIPSSLTATLYGHYGFHFKPGDAEDLYRQLMQVNTISREEFSRQVKSYFRQELSFEAIGRKFIESCRAISG